MIAGSDQSPDELGELRTLEVRVNLGQDVDYPLALSKPTDLHSIGIAVGHEGWDCEPWVQLTLEQASTLRDLLDTLIQLGQDDKLALHSQGVTTVVTG